MVEAALEYRLLRRPSMKVLLLITNASLAKQSGQGHVILVITGPDADR